VHLNQKQLRSLLGKSYTLSKIELNLLGVARVVSASVVAFVVVVGASKVKTLYLYHIQLIALKIFFIT